MTDVTFTFNSETRSLKRNNRAYVGQAFDSLSTTLHFEYDPIDFLSGNSDYATEGYVPYIMFRVYDDAGNPLIYSAGSTPRFDGYTFDIPWDVTSRVRTRSIEFQLYFIRNNIDFDGDLTELDSTEYVISAIASIAFQETIRCKPGCSPCAPSSPQTEPGLNGYLNFFKDYAVLTPVRMTYDPEQDRLIQHFRTYLGRADCDIVLDVPYLAEDGRIPHWFLPLISEWLDHDGALIATDENVPTALLVHRSLDQKTDKDMAIPLWEADREYHLYSVVIGPDGCVYRSLTERNVGNDPSEDYILGPEYWQRIAEYDVIIHDWADALDENVPSSQLVKDSLDQKTDKDMAIPMWEEGVEYGMYSVVIGPDGNLYRSLDGGNLGNDPRLDDVLDPTHWQRIMEYDAVRNDWDELGWGTVPSTNLVKTSLDQKTGLDMAIPMWDPSTEYHVGSTVICTGTIYISNGDQNIGNDPSEDDGTWWTTVSCDGEGAGKPIIRVLGDGYQREFTVRHGLGTRDLFTALRYTDTECAYTDAKIVAVSDDHVRVFFSVPPKPREFTLIVSDTSDVSRVFKTRVGDGSSTSFELVHGFGTRNFFTSIRNNLDNEFVTAKVVATDYSKATVSFSVPPQEEQYTVIIVPFFLDLDPQGYTYTQDVPSDVWEFENPMDRPVMIYTVDADGYRIYGDEWQDLGGIGGKVVIRFSEPQTGTAILR